MTKPEKSAGAGAQDELESQAEPIKGGDALKVAVEDIVLPPKELRDELDNSGESDEAGQEPEIATLDFFGDELPEHVHPLRYKFRWQGKPVTEITIRALNVIDTGKVYAQARRKNGKFPNVYDLYAEMTGLPASVLRALKGEDGDAVAEKCWDFLSPSLRAAYE